MGDARLTALEELRAAQKAWDAAAQDYRRKLSGIAKRGRWRIERGEKLPTGPLTLSDSAPQPHKHSSASPFFIAVSGTNRSGTTGRTMRAWDAHFSLETLAAMQVAMDYALEQDFTIDELKRIYGET
jgi:hypothetical protein